MSHRWGLFQQPRPHVGISTDAAQRGLQEAGGNQYAPGALEYTRLPFGVALAPAVFQRAMDQILHVICYLDDILVMGRTVEEHHKHLRQVLSRLQEHGVRLKKVKCSFCVDSVEHLGYRINAQGVHTTYRKVQTIVDTPAPKNVTSAILPGYVKHFCEVVTPPTVCITSRRQAMEVVRGV